MQTTRHQRKVLRIALLCSILLIPFITGTIAVIGEYKNMWNGVVETPFETFQDYAIPIPMAAGCFQLFLWPLTYGAVLLLSLIRNFPLFCWTLIVYLGGVLMFGLAEGGFFSMFTTVDVSMIFLVSVGWTIWLVLALRRKASDYDHTPDCP